MTNGNEPTILPDFKKVFVSREDFLKMLGLTLSGMIGLMVTVPGVGFILNYLFLDQESKWVGIGEVDKYKEGQTVDVVFEDPYTLPWEGVTGKRSAWVRREDDGKLLAFATYCTHLGCPVRWEAKAGLFMCPCHGGVYYSNGDVAGGPPPRPLHQYPLRISADGKIELQVTPILIEG